MKSVNNKITKAVILIAASYGSQALAAQVGSLTTFTAGTTAVATEVNGNFDALSTAVNDNDSRVTAAETAITAVEGTSTTNTYNIDQVNIKATTNEANITINTADIATNSTNIGTNATSITNLNASVTAMQNGTLSVGPMSMKPSLGSGCVLDFNATNGYVAYNSSTALSICNMVSNIHLPQGMTSGGLTCRILDNDGSANTPLVTLYRANLDGSAPEVMFQTGTVTDSASVQTVSDFTNATIGTIDNTTYSYYLTFEHGSVDTSAATNSSLRFYNCALTYGNLL